jgi:hypothetical protein
MTDSSQPLWLRQSIEALLEVQRAQRIDAERDRVSPKEATDAALLPLFVQGRASGRTCVSSVTADLRGPGWERRQGLEDGLEVS